MLNKIKEAIFLILAIIGGAWTIISIYSYFSAKKPNIEAIIYYSDIISSEEKIESSFSTSGFYTISIHNKGSAATQNIQIYIPETVAYALKEGNNTSNITSVENSKIKIAELAPKEKLEYVAWARYPIPAYRWEKEISAYDESGSIKIKPLYLVGKTGYLVDTFIHYPLILKILLLTPLIFLFLFGYFFKKEPGKSNKENKKIHEE